MKKQSGQAVLMSVMLLGIIMATIIVFGAKRLADVSLVTARLDSGQSAAEVLSAAAKRVQAIYANESSCDPRVLNTRLSRLPNLALDPTTLGLGSSVTYITAQPGLTSASAARFNLCDTTGLGCRQLAINLGNKIYVVTVGNVITHYVDPGTTPTDSPQDAAFRLSVTIAGSNFSQWSTLENICTLGSRYGDQFTGTTVTVPSSGSITAPACSNIPVRHYGAITGGTVATPYTIISVDDLRWARRYLETGAGSVGETSYMVYNTPNPETTNGSCPAATNPTICKGQDCIPALDLNYDLTNNEADLAILEHLLRGYLLSTPISYLR